MPLPKIEKVYYETNLISSGKKIHVRPFDIGEQKNIMLIKENQPKQLTRKIMELISNCIKEKINIMELYPAEMEKLFYDIKSYSDGDIITFEYPYTDDEKKECKQTIEINTKEDFLLTNKIFKTTINVPEQNMIINFRQPVMKDALKIDESNLNDTEKSFLVMALCLDSVSVGEETYVDFTLNEAKEFIDELSINVIEKISNFFKNQPELYCNKKFTLNGCKEPKTFTNDEVRGFLA